MRHPSTEWDQKIGMSLTGDQALGYHHAPPSREALIPHLLARSEKSCIRQPMGPDLTHSDPNGPCRRAGTFMAAGFDA